MHRSVRCGSALGACCVLLLWGPGSDIGPHIRQRAAAALISNRGQHRRGVEMSNDVAAEADELKERGNLALKRGDLPESIRLYTAALALAPENTVYLSNRSAAHLQQGDAASALSDAERCTELAPKWPKSWLRKSNALLSLGRRQLAADAFRSGLSEVEKLEAAGLRKAFAKALPDEYAAWERPSKGRRRRKKFPELYEEQPATDAGREQAAAARVLERVKAAAGSGTDALVEGVFQKLLDPVAFRRAVYPGVVSVPDGLPSSFQELIAHPVYSEELVRLLPGVKKKAETVLANVKRRGAAEGDIMDATTEAQLRPQVFNEAFARAVMDMMNTTNRRLNAEMARREVTVASAYAAQADWDQVASETLASLADDDRGFALQDAFLGDEWQGLLRQDAERLKRSGKMDPVPQLTAGCMCWLHAVDLEEEYPALHEAVTRLSALPYELNKKLGLKLAEPLPGAVMLTCLAASGGAAARRLDNVGGDGDNGYKVSCVFTFNPRWQHGGDGLLRLCGKRGSGQAEEFDQSADRLFLFRSRAVTNEVLAAEQEDDVFALSLWFSGAESNGW